jgi:hypothetical protein
MRSPALPRWKPPSLALAATDARASEEDLREYLPYLGDMHLSEDQKIELLQTLWSILSAFVDQGFGVDSVHLAQPQHQDGTAETDAAAE